MLEQYLRRMATDALASTDRAQRSVDQLLGATNPRDLDHNGLG
jgi:hypothetical protein